MKPSLNMRILCLITISFFFISIVISDGDVPSGANVQRVPRALVLRPVMKIDSTEEDDDDDDDDGNPFDWISNAFKNMIKPAKKVQNNRKFLGPITVPGLNNDVFIKQLQSNAKKRVVIKVMPQSNINIPYDQSQYYNQQYQSQRQRQPQPQPQPAPSPASAPLYYHQQLQKIPTRQLPSQTSSGFMPVSSPTLSSWTQTNQYYQQPSQYQQNYNKNLPNNNNNYQYQHYQQPHYQYSNPINYQSYYQPYSSPYSNQQYNSYGSYNYNADKNIKTSTTNNYSNSLRPTNYPIYPPYNEQSHDNYNNYNHTINNNEYDHLQIDDIKTQLPTIKTTTAKTTLLQYNEVFRTDRMVPTNPTWKNRFWVNNKSRNSSTTSTTSTTSTSTTTTTTTTERSYDDDDNSNKNINDDNDSDDQHRGNKRSLKNINKFSSTSIEKISAPYLNNKKENDSLSDSSSRMDDDDDNDSVIIKNNSRLNRGESLDHTDWKSSKISNENKLNNLTELNFNRIMSLSENHWKHYNLKRPFKNISDKLITNNNKNNKNNKIRVVENVISSVSMTSSKGTQKLSKSKNHSQ